MKSYLFLGLSYAFLVLGFISGQGSILYAFPALAFGICFYFLNADQNVKLFSIISIFLLFAIGNDFFNANFPIGEGVDLTLVSAMFAAGLLVFVAIKRRK